MDILPYSTLPTPRRASYFTYIMFSIDKSVPVNANLKPGDPVLTRDHIWEGLLMKAYDAKPFVHLMTKCEVTREFENGIERDIVFRGMELTERLIFYPTPFIIPTLKRISRSFGYLR